MSKLHYTPVHPGEVLQDELEEIRLTQSALAKHIGVLPKTINDLDWTGTLTFKPLAQTWAVKM